MNKRDILERELEVLEELKELGDDKQDEGEQQGEEARTLRDLADPKYLGRLRKLVWPF